MGFCSLKKSLPPPFSACQPFVLGSPRRVQSSSNFTRKSVSNQRENPTFSANIFSPNAGKRFVWKIAGMEKVHLSARSWMGWSWFWDFWANNSNNSNNNSNSNNNNNNNNNNTSTDTNSNRISSANKKRHELARSFIPPSSLILSGGIWGWISSLFVCQSWASYHTGSHHKTDKYATKKVPLGGEYVGSQTTLTSMFRWWFFFTHLGPPGWLSRSCRQQFPLVPVPLTPVMGAVWCPGRFGYWKKGCLAKGMSDWNVRTLHDWGSHVKLLKLSRFFLHT